MKKYLILKQKEYDETLFEIKDLETEEKFIVDLYTNGNFQPDDGSDESIDKWKKWLKEKFEGKIIEIETISPMTYSIFGEAKLTN